jgi:phage shock protein A
MLKLFTTLLRGAAAAAEEEVADRHALLILDQQIRDAAAGVEQCKRALAIAIAQDETEGKRLEKVTGRIADLEERAVAALDGGREDLATEAAEVIAVLEADRDAVQEARATFGAEIAGLKRAYNDAARRLADLERGRRVAQVGEAISQLKKVSRPGAAQLSALAEAEATLKRLREQQAQAIVADAALDALDPEAASLRMADRLEAEGFGRRTKPNAASVLERLKQRASSAKDNAA